jgi:hypothetical protein
MRCQSDRADRLEAQVSPRPVSYAKTQTILPRGWVVLGLALSSCALMALMFQGISTLFGYVAAAI